MLFFSRSVHLPCGNSDQATYRDPGFQAQTVIVWVFASTARVSTYVLPTCHNVLSTCHMAVSDTCNVLVWSLYIIG